MKIQIFSKRWGAVLVLALIVLAADPTWAQPQGRAYRGGERHRVKREQVQTIIIGKFSTELELTPQQAEQFFPRFQQFQGSMEEIQRQVAERREQMDGLAYDENANEAQVQQLLTTQSDQMQQIVGLKEQFLIDVSSFLSPQQLSRCAILMEEMPQRVREYMRQRQTPEAPSTAAPPSTLAPESKRSKKRVY